MTHLTKWEHLRDKIEVKSHNKDETPFSFDPTAFVQFREREFENSPIPRRRRHHASVGNLSLYDRGRNSSNDRFFAQLEEQTSRLATERSSMFLNDQKLQELTEMPVRKSLGKYFSESLSKGALRLPSLTRGSTKSIPNLSGIFAKRREPVRELVDKKREIFRSRMSVMMKVDETNKLSDLMLNQEEALQNQEEDLDNDTEFARRWMHELAREAGDAAKKTEEEGREKVKKMEEINKLRSEEDYWNRKIAETKAELDILRGSKALFDILNPERKKELPKQSPQKKNTDEDFLITQPYLAKALGVDPENDENYLERALRNGNFKTPEEVHQHLVDLERKNEFLSEYVQSLEDELEKDRKNKEAQKAQLESVANEMQSYLKSKIAVRNQEQVKSEGFSKVQQKEQAQMFQFSDVGNINMKAVRHKVLEVYQKCMKTEKVDETLRREAPDLANDLQFVQETGVMLKDEIKITVNLLRIIEKGLRYYINFKNDRINSNEVGLIQELDQKIYKENRKIEKAAKLAEEEQKRAELLRRRRERIMQPTITRVGRRDVSKRLFGVKKKVRSVMNSIEIEPEDDGEKFFDKDYHFQDFDKVVENKKKKMRKALSQSVLI